MRTASGLQVNRNVRALGAVGGDRDPPHRTRGRAGPGDATHPAASPARGRHGRRVKPGDGAMVSSEWSGRTIQMTH